MALSIFPDPVTGRYKDATWQAIGEELKTLLSPEEYDSAKRTTFNAFYTSPTVIAAMHEAIGRLGVPTTAIVLEPGCGTGNFMRLCRDGMRFIGVELDSISGRIAKAIHPDHDIRIENFRDTRLPEDSIDAVIGNVPFADVKLDYHGQKLSLHDFFFAKSVDALKPGGVLALVTTISRSTSKTPASANISPPRPISSGRSACRPMRSNAKGRRSSPTSSSCGSGRRRTCPTTSIRNGSALRRLSIEGVEIPINRYFLNHPEMVLGTWSRKDTLYGGETATASSATAISPGKLQAAIQRSAGIRCRQSRSCPGTLCPGFHAPAAGTPHHRRQLSSSATIASFASVIDGQVRTSRCTAERMLKSGGTHDRQTACRADPPARSWPAASCNRRTKAGPNPTATKHAGTSTGPMTASSPPTARSTKPPSARPTTARVIRRMPNLVKFREDPDAMLVMSLEEYDEATGKATKAAIMKKDVVGKNPPITSVKTAEEGLLVSLDRRGARSICLSSPRSTASPRRQSSPNWMT